jgi:hypothetical protein
VIALAVSACGAPAPTPTVSSAPTAFRGSATDIAVAAQAAGFVCAPFSHAYGYVVTECRRGGTGAGERDLIDVYARPDETVAGLDMIAGTQAGTPAIGEVVQIAVQRALDADLASSILAAVRTNADAGLAPTPLPGGLELRITTLGASIREVVLLAPDLVLHWGVPPAP